MKITQNQKLLMYFNRVKSTPITESKADKMYGVKNLRARIFELRSDGYQIQTVRNRLGNVAYKLGV